MNRQISLLQTPLVGLTSFDHPSEEPHEDPPAEQAGGFSVNFVLHGSFGLRIHRESWRMTPGQVFVTRPGLEYVCRHEEEHPTDVCLSLDYRQDPAEIGDSFWQAPRAEDNGRPVVPRSDRVGYLGWRLHRLLTSPTLDLELEGTAAELWQTVAMDEDRTEPVYREAQLAWYAERIDAARQAMAAHCERDHSLRRLASDVAMSPFHFARVFRRLCGIPPHQFLLQVRLRRALERLRQGASVTEAGLDCGFNSPSYFSRLFCRRFGVPPSRFSELGKKVHASGQVAGPY
ncbi:MAG: AraC family transcriptional regulator [Acidobacteriota bacterium]